MRKMWSLWIFLSIIYTVFSDIHITLEHIGDKDTVSFKPPINLTLPGKKLTRIKGLANEYNFVQIHGYSNSELEAVDLFPTLKYLWMEKLGQKEIPVLGNVPQIRTLNLAYNQITRVKTDVINWSTLQVIYLDTNEINWIEDEAFGYRVTWVNLRCNKIVDLSGKWFSNPSIVKRINLHGNLIEYVPERVFANFSSLNDLNLSSNKIIRIGYKAFVGSTNYEWFFLADNQLTIIEHNIFKQNTIIQRLLLQNNNLTFLPSNLLRRVHVKGVGLVNGNPWQCPCYEKIQSWLPQNFYVGAPLYVTRMKLLKNSSVPHCVQKYSNKFTDEFCEEWVDPKVIQIFRETFKPFENSEPVCEVENYEHTLDLL